MLDTRLIIFPSVHPFMFMLLLFTKREQTQVSAVLFTWTVASVIFFFVFLNVTGYKEIRLHANLWHMQFSQSPASFHDMGCGFYWNKRNAWGTRLLT